VVSICFGKNTVSMKTVPLGTMIDRHIGKMGTPDRDAFENELRMDLIGEAIRQARLERNLTQKELGELVGVQKAQISKLENSLTDVRYHSQSVQGTGRKGQFQGGPHAAVPEPCLIPEPLMFVIEAMKLETTVAAAAVGVRRGAVLGAGDSPILEVTLSYRNKSSHLKNEKAMMIERTQNEIIFRFPKSMDLDDLQDLTDFFEYRELTRKSNATKKDVDVLVKAVKKGRWEKTKQQVV